MKRLACAIVGLLLLALIVQIASAQSTRPPAQDKALSFITDVINLDMTRYSASLTHYDNQSQGKRQEMVIYNLDDDGKSTRASCKFEAGFLTMSIISPPANVPLAFAQHTGDKLSLAKGILSAMKLSLETQACKK